MDENTDMRNMLLSELIDNMHSRLADKMFPPDPSKDDQPAVSGIVGPEHEAMGQDIPMVNPPAVEDEKSIDVDHDADEPTDEEIEEMLK
jgi:hypothetical protein